MRGRGGGGRGRGRGGFGGSALPPMGLTFADIQAMSREATAMYPSMRPPVLKEFSQDEKLMASYQTGFANRLRKSQYYIVETVKTDELPRYSDKYRPSVAGQPKLEKDQLHAPFFPPDLFQTYFNEKRRKRRHQTGKKLKVGDLGKFETKDDEDEDKSDNDSQGGNDSDYDVDEEYDNDYAENYFDNGEGDDMDDLGGGGGGDDYGGGGDYD